MSWHSARIALPEQWWDRLREKDRLPDWWLALKRWVCSETWTHVHHQTHRRAIRDPFASAELYSRYLAAHASRYLLTGVLWAVEPHPGGHGSHIHALWKTRYDALREYSSAVNRTAAPPLPLYRLVLSSSNHWLGYSRLWPIDGTSCQVVAYTLKYIVKGIRNLERKTFPMPWEPQEREPMWGWLTFPARSH